MLRTNLELVFTSASHPRHICVFRCRAANSGDRVWTACVKAELTSVIGKPLGTETYRVTISSGAIIDRRRAEADDICGSESYEPCETAARGRRRGSAPGPFPGKT